MAVVTLCYSSPTTPLPGLEKFVPLSLCQNFRARGRVPFLAFGSHRVASFPFFAFLLSASAPPAKRPFGGYPGPAYLLAAVCAQGIGSCGELSL